MTYGEFQERYEEEGGKERARYDARPVADLLADIRAGRFSDQYQIWYSLGARATLAEAGPTLLAVLESDLEYLHRYHCAAALIAIAQLDPKIYEPATLSVGTPESRREKVAELRRLLQIAPAAPITVAPSVAPSAPALPPPMPAAPRSRALTVFAWIVMIGSGLMIPISVISGAMLLAGSYGTNTATPLGIFTVVFSPAIMLAAGFGLWRRWKWAWLLAIGMFALSIIVNTYTILTSERGTRQFVSPSGTVTTVTSDGGSSRWGFVVVAAAANLFLIRPRVRAEFFGRLP